MINYPITLPSSPYLSGLKLVQRTTVGMTRSPFTGNIQKQVWPAEWWEIQGSLPPMKRDGGGAAWEAALHSLCGPYGCFRFDPLCGKGPRGALGGTPIIYLGSQTGRILATYGWTPSITGVLKAGDFIRYGGGINGTRIKTSGGSIADKGYLTILTPSVNGVPYQTDLMVYNIGAKAVTFSNNITGGTTQTVAAGAEAAVSIQCAGDGASNYILSFSAPAAGDSLDFIAWSPVGAVWGTDTNLIPIANRTFTTVAGYSGVTVTKTQGQNQRLYQVTKDVNSNSGGWAAVDIWPALRESPGNGDPIIVNGATGLFQLAGNSQGRSMDPSQIYTGMDFNAVEVL